MESYYTGSDAPSIGEGKGFPFVTDYKGKHSREFPSDADLPNELNAFYAGFEEYNTVP